MKKLQSLISLSSILLAFLMAGTAAAVEIVGAGASLPDPIKKSWTIEGIEPGRLTLDGEALAKIYLGKIAKWNAPAIVALNRDLKLPDANIAVIYRSDASGSTFLLTNYLSNA